MCKNFPNKCGSMCLSKPGGTWLQIAPFPWHQFVIRLALTSSHHFLNQVTHDLCTAPLASTDHAVFPGTPKLKNVRFQRCLHTPSAETLRVWLMNVGMFRPPKAVESGGFAILLHKKLGDSRRYGKLETYSPESVKKLRIKKPESRRRKMAKSSSGGRSVDCFIYVLYVREYTTHCYMEFMRGH